jgi:hypothetical protein
MKVVELVVRGLEAVARIVTGIRDSRKANVKDALQSTAAGRAAHEAATRAGRK